MALALLLGQGAWAQEAQEGEGVVIRALDKLSGRVLDVEVPIGATARFDRIEIDHAACRYPFGNPDADAYALLRVRDVAEGREVFKGWMIASAPAVSALDHARYDVWVLRCITGEEEDEPVEAAGEEEGEAEETRAAGPPVSSPRPTPRP